MRLGDILRRQSDAATPESSPGGPVYDARIDPTVSAGEIVGSERLQAQRDLHLFYGKSAAAEAFSHAWDSQPSALAAQMQGLAQERDQIERIVSRRDWPPFPGVELGHVPGFHAAPSTNPVLQPFAHFGHHAHQVESKRATRARFGH